MINYTLIVYREDHDDYCRGCHMGSTHSYHEVYYSTDTDEIVQNIAHYLYEEMSRGKNYEYASYEFTLCINGNPDYYDEDDENLSSCQLKENLINSARAISENKLNRVRQEEANLKALEKKKADALAKEKQEKLERETLELLKAKYE